MSLLGASGAHFFKLEGYLASRFLASENRKSVSDLCLIEADYMHGACTRGCPFEAEWLFSVDFSVLSVLLCLVL